MEKIESKHGVFTDEVEECFKDPRRKIRKARAGRYHLFARTFEGRYLFVVYVPLDGIEVRVITARDMDDTERRVYGRK